MDNEKTFNFEEFIDGWMNARMGMNYVEHDGVQRAFLFRIWPKQELTKYEMPMSWMAL